MNIHDLQKNLNGAMNDGKAAAWNGGTIKENPFKPMDRREPGFLLNQALRMTWKINYVAGLKEIKESGYNPKTGKVDPEFSRRKELEHSKKMSAYYERRKAEYKKLRIARGQDE